MLLSAQMINLKGKDGMVYNYNIRVKYKIEEYLGQWLLESDIPLTYSFFLS